MTFGENLELPYIVSQRREDMMRSCADAPKRLDRR